MAIPKTKSKSGAKQELVKPDRQGVNHSWLQVQLLPIILPVIIAVITWFALSRVLQNGFTNWDDNVYVWENKSLPKPASDAIPYFFGQHYFIGNYVPVTMTVFWLIYQKVQLNQEYYHLVNLLLHLANVVLVFIFIWMLSNKRIIVATICALFFGIHPMHVESVAWVAELKDVLYTFFYLSALIPYYFYARHFVNSQKSSIQNRSLQLPYHMLLLLTCIFYLLSCMSKPAAIVLPLSLLLVDYFLKRRPDIGLWLEKIPFFAASVVFGIIAIQAQQADRLVHNDYSAISKICFASYSLIMYLFKFIAPINLSILYPYPKIDNGLLPFYFYLTPFVIFGIVWAIYRYSKGNRLFSFGLLFFLVNLVLVLQFVSIGDAIMADRYTYVPYIGLLFIVGMVTDRLFTDPKPAVGQIRAGVVLFLLAASVACFVTTQARCKIWEDDETIATDFLEKFPNDRIALNNEGFLLFNQHKYQEAIQLFDKAIAIKPDYLLAYINLTKCYLAMHDFENTGRVVELAFKNAKPDFNVWNARGYVRFKNHDYQRAIDCYRASLNMKPMNIDAYILLAQCFFEQKEIKHWQAVIDTGLSIEPNNFVLLNSRGYGFFLDKKYDEANKYFDSALKINPNYGIAAENKAVCRRAMQDTTARR